MMKKQNENDMITKLLTETDFSKENDSKDAIRNRILSAQAECQNSQGEVNMKRFRLKPAMIVAATLALTLSISIFAYGEDILRIVKEVTLGEHVNYYARDIDTATKSLPPELQGIIFDAEGSELKAIPENGEFYTKDGVRAQAIYESDKGTFKLVTEEELHNMMAEQGEQSVKASAYTFFENIDDARAYVAFDFIMPSALPEGYAFDQAQLYSGDSDQPLPIGKSKFLEYTLTNANTNKKIYANIFLIDEDTAFDSYTTRNMQEITINGHKGIVDTGRVDIEIDGIMYRFFNGGSSELTDDDLIKMVESMQ